MPGKGIDHSTCPKARIVRSLWSAPEKAFYDVLREAMKKKPHVFLKVRVLDVIDLDAAEPDKKRLFFWRDILGDKHFDYVVCRRETLEPLLAVELDDPTTGRRSTTADDGRRRQSHRRPTGRLPDRPLRGRREPDAGTGAREADRGVPGGPGGGAAGGDGVSIQLYPGSWR
jgi:hypothetical protein